MTYTKTYYSPGDPGWANGMILFDCIESEVHHENELYLWNDDTKSYDKVTEKEYEVRLHNRKKLAPPIDCWIA